MSRNYRYIRILTVILCGAVLPFGVTRAMAETLERQDELKIGADMPKPDLELILTDKTTTTLDDVAGEKGTVVAFWANHCPFVVRYEDRFIELASTYRDKGIAFIAVSSNDPIRYEADNLENMAKRVEDKGYTFRYAFDEGSRLAAAFGATRTPHIYLFNADRELVYVGAVDDSTDPEKVETTYLKDAMDAVLAGDDVPITNSRAIGCTIKWQN